MEGTGLTDSTTTTTDQQREFDVSRLINVSRIIEVSRGIERSQAFKMARHHFWKAVVPAILIYNSWLHFWESVFLSIFIVSLWALLFQKGKYVVTVIADNINPAKTFNEVRIRLMGQNGDSHLKKFREFTHSSTGHESTFSVSAPYLGKLLMIELEVRNTSDQSVTEDSWYVTKVIVKSPKGDTFNFPVYEWITDRMVYLREATALKDSDDTDCLSKKSRKLELKERRKIYKWDIHLEGIPHCVEAENASSLPPEVRFSFTKTIGLKFTAITGLIDLKLDGLQNSKDNWTSMDDLEKMFLPRQKTDMSGYVQKHWKEDRFFGYQYLNGSNPMLIKCCKVLPANFPVTEEMVFRYEKRELSTEMQKGNIFLCDYKLLAGVKSNVIDDKKQYLVAPLVLLHRTDDNELVPIAIQLKQEPAEDNPIFLPTDSEYDWLTAKVFVRNADFNLHQLNFHLLRTHLLAEAFAVSLLRNVTKVHPLYKLLVPHTRYTLQINVLARNRLLSEEGVFNKITSSGGEGVTTILTRAQSLLTYSSLCIPDDITERGLNSVPNFYYRDDGLRLWDIINRFVEKLLKHYYTTDEEVQDDTELQNWIKTIFERGFLSQESTGLPKSFSNLSEVVKFVTMVIFTCSGQHSAVNSGQYDYAGWMPNNPTSLQQPPPTTKGSTSETTLLRTFPTVGVTVQGMSVMHILSKPSYDVVPLGQYPEERFTEKIPCMWIDAFQADLKGLSSAIKARNASLEIPYTYLDPEVVENSVAI